MSTITYLNAIQSALHPLGVAFSRYFTAEHVRFYVGYFSNRAISPDLLRTAIQSLIGTSKYPPTIAEINDEIRKIESTLSPEPVSDPYTAWEHVLTAASSYGFDEGLTTLSELEAHAAKAVGWWEICYGDLGDTSLRRAHFLKAYTHFAEQRTWQEEIKPLLATASSTPKLNEAITKLAEAKSM